MIAPDAGAAPRGEPWAAAVETHISGVVFAGGLVYKQLKAIATPFLDHRTVDQRRVALETELQLNRRLAPDVYLGTMPVLDVGGGGTGDPAATAIEHLLVMRRLPAARALSRLVDADDFDDHLREVARAVAAFHASLDPDPEAVDIASTDAERTRWRDNLTEMRAATDEVFDPDALDVIERLSGDYLRHREPLFVERARAGLARDGHGDLLAADIFCLDDGPRILDCLAFDPALRLGDVLADVAFLVMDVERLAGSRPARRLLAWYQQFSDEHHPASLAHHYVAYRALVRAKVTALRHAQTGDPDDRRAARDLLAQCVDHLHRGRVRLVLVGGGPGTGKSTVANAIGDVMTWPILATDELRKEQAGLDATTHALARPDEGLYTSERTERAYQGLLDRATVLLARGESVILDASWSREAHRELARRTARDAGATVVELECVLDPAVAKERIVRRLSSPWTVSDATPEIVDHMAMLHDPWPQATTIDTAEAPAHNRAVALRACLDLEEVRRSLVDGDHVGDGGDDVGDGHRPG